VPGPIILRDLLEEQIEALREKGRLAFIPNFRLEEGETLMIWWESGARWVYATVETLIEKPSYTQYEEHLEYSGYSTVQAWLNSEEKRLGGVLPRRLAIIRLEGEQ
jgi:antibiotic biosynthesis monooxygenase (ABM) superfamily enzyme